MAAATATAGDIAVLYDPDLVPGTTQTPDEKGQDFGKLSSDIFNQEGFYAAGDGVTEFDTTYDPEIYAVFGTHSVFDGTQRHPRAQVLDRSAGFRVSFDLAIRSEQHDEALDPNGDGVSDSGSFSIGIISSDLKGLGIQFWADRIWITEDDSEGEEELFTHAEFFEQTAEEFGQLRRYDFEFKDDGYRIRIDGETVLTGLIRDYSNFQGVDVPVFGNVNSFDKPNSITFGDPSNVSMSQVAIGDITSETPYDPPAGGKPQADIEIDENGEIVLHWDSIPGVLYSIRSSDDLGGFVEFDDYFARTFEEKFTDSRPQVARRYYKIVPLVTTP